MKKLLATLLLLLSAAISRATDIKLEWDDAQPGATYRIEISPAVPVPVWTVAKADIPQVAAPSAQGTTLTNITPGVYLLRAFAVVNGVESEPSDTLMDVKAQPSAPGKPRVVVRITVEVE